MTDSNTIIIPLKSTYYKTDYVVVKLERTSNKSKQNFGSKIQITDLNSQKLRQQLRIKRTQSHFYRNYNASCAASLVCEGTKLCCIWIIRPIRSQNEVLWYEQHRFLSFLAQSCNTLMCVVCGLFLSFSFVLLSLYGYLTRTMVCYKSVADNVTLSLFVRVVTCIGYCWWAEHLFLAPAFSAICFKSFWTEIERCV